MQSILMDCDQEETFRRVNDAVEDVGGKTVYSNQAKGILIFGRTWTSWFPNMTMVVDVTEGPGGCIVVLHAFIPGAPLEQRSRLERYERKVADSMQRAI